LGYYWTFVNVCRFFFGINATPTAKISPELMQQAQHEFAGTAQMYIKELEFAYCDHPHLFSHLFY
jgi:hypothetical protein